MNIVRCDRLSSILLRGLVESSWQGNSDVIWEKYARIPQIQFVWKDLLWRSIYQLGFGRIPALLGKLLPVRISLPLVIFCQHTRRCNPDDGRRRNPRSEDPKLRPRAEVINKHGRFGRTQFLWRMSVVELSQEGSTVSVFVWLAVCHNLCCCDSTSSVMGSLGLCFAWRLKMHVICWQRMCLLGSVLVSSVTNGRNDISVDKVADKTAVCPSELRDCWNRQHSSGRPGEWWCVPLCVDTCR
jgi:hypothetical protein